MGRSLEILDLSWQLTEILFTQRELKPFYNVAPRVALPLREPSGRATPRLYARLTCTSYGALSQEADQIPAITAKTLLLEQ